MPDDVPPYRVEPDIEFADRLERELLQRLGVTPSIAPADRETDLQVLEVHDDAPIDSGLIDTALDAGERTTRRRRVLVAAAAAAAIVFAAGVVAYTSSVGERIETTAPSSTAPVANVTSTTIDPAPYVAIADAFMDAWVAGDGAAVVARFGDPLTREDSPYVDPEDPFPLMRLGAIDLVSDDGPTGGLPAIWDVATLPALHDWFRAVGFEFGREPCRSVPHGMPEVADAASVVCDYTYENDLTRALDRKAVNERFVFEIHGDTVALLSGGIFDVDAAVWQTFSDWVLSAHADDWPVMFDANSVTPQPRLDDASIALWERHVDEFVSSPEAHGTPAGVAPTRAQFDAQARAICATAALDAEANWWWGGAGSLEQASQDAMEQLRALPRPEEDAAQIDQLFVLLEEINHRVVTDSWFHNSYFYDLQTEKDALGGRDYWGCPVGPLGG